MRKSTNYGLKLMEGTDNVKRQDFVDNFEIIDKEMKSNNTSLKEIANNKASKTELEELKKTVSNIDLSATKVNLTAINGMSAKNVQTGMQELFTFASNGKSAIAGKVGNVTGSNTHTEIANRIQADKNTMANNLNNKGVSANENEALASLVSKIGNITTNGFSYGEAHTSITGQGEKHEIFINVGFKPSAVVLYNYNTVKGINNLYIPSLELFLGNDFSMGVRVTENGFYACETFNRPGGDVVRYICFK